MKTTMNEQFIPYELSLELKQLGFNESCFGYYNESKEFILELGVINSNYNKPGMHGEYCTAILYQQAFDFFREKYNLDCFCRAIESSGKSYWKISKLYDDGNIKGYSGFAKTYEKAQLECLHQLIEICKKN